MKHFLHELFGSLWDIIGQEKRIKIPTGNLVILVNFKLIKDFYFFDFLDFLIHFLKL